MWLACEFPWQLGKFTSNIDSIFSRRHRNRNPRPGGGANGGPMAPPEHTSNELKRSACWSPRFEEDGWKKRIKQEACINLCYGKDYILLISFLGLRPFFFFFFNQSQKSLRFAVYYKHRTLPSAFFWLMLQKSCTYFLPPYLKTGPFYYIQKVIENWGNPCHGQSGQRHGQANRVIYNVDDIINLLQKGWRAIFPHNNPLGTDGRLQFETSIMEVTCQ